MNGENNRRSADEVVIGRGFMHFSMVGVLVLLNSDTLISAYAPLPVNPALILFGYSAVVLVVHVSQTKGRLSSLPVWGFGVLVCFVLLSMLVNQDFRNGYVVVVMGFVCGLACALCVPFPEFAEWTTRWMIGLTVCSVLITYSLKPVVLRFPQLFPQFVNSAGLPLANAWLSYVVRSPNYYRNFGIFRESGVYQVFLNLALVLELFVNRTPKTLRTTILLIGIISTFSTAGYLVTLIVLLAYLSDRRGLTFRSVVRWFVPVAGMLGLLITVYRGNALFRSQFDQTWSKLFLAEKSFHVRRDSIYAALEVWWERPLLGHGITDGFSRMLSLLALSEYGIRDQTSTTGSMLATLGLMPGVILTGMLCRLSKILSLRNQWLLFGALLLALNSQFLMYNQFIYALIFYSLAARGQAKSRV